MQFVIDSLSHEQKHKKKIPISLAELMTNAKDYTVWVE